MKNSIKTITTCVILAVATFSVQADNAATTKPAIVEKIGYVNVEQVVQAHPSREAISKKLDAEFKEPTEKLKKEDQAIFDKMKKLEKDMPNLRRADIQKRQVEINKLREKFDEAYKKLDEKTMKRHMEEDNKLYLDIQKTVQEVAQAKGYTVILNERMLISIGIDKNITEDVIKALKPLP